MAEPLACKILRQISFAIEFCFDKQVEKRRDAINLGGFWRLGENNHAYRDGFGIGAEKLDNFDIKANIFKLRLDFFLENVSRNVSNNYLQGMVFREIKGELDF